jgi:purine-binding chemotaxis protein CheW
MSVPAAEDAHVLRLRAAALAKPETALARDLMDVLAFAVAGHALGIELRHLREARPLAAFAPLPFARAGVLGVAHVRGRMLAVLDLAQLLGLGGGAVPPTGLLVVGAQAPEFGVAVDRMPQLRSMRLGEIQRDAAVIDGLGRDLVQGISPDGLILLAGDALVEHGDRLRVNNLP